MPPVTSAPLTCLTPLRPSASAVPVTDLPAAVNRGLVRVLIVVETQKATVVSDANLVTMVTRPPATPTPADPVRVLSRHTTTRK